MVILKLTDHENGVFFINAINVAVLRPGENLTLIGMKCGKMFYATEKAEDIARAMGRVQTFLQQSTPELAANL